jgi:hypothetical protein
MCCGRSGWLRLVIDVFHLDQSLCSELTTRHTQQLHHGPVADERPEQSNGLCGAPCPWQRTGWGRPMRTSWLNLVRRDTVSSTR